MQVSGFEEVYEAEYMRMVRVGAMLTGSTARAEQVVQDAFVALYPRFDAEADPAEDLYRAVIEAGRSTRGTGVPWSAVADLAPQERAVVVLRYYAGLHPTEVASVLGLGAGTVRATLEAAGDEAGHRRRLAALAVTIAVRPGWDRIRDRLDAAPAPARRREVLMPSRLGRLAGAAAVALAAAVVVVAARQGGGGTESARDAASTTTTTRLRTRASSSTAPAAATPPGAAAAAAPGELPVAGPRSGAVLPYDLPRTLDMLGLGVGPQDGGTGDGGGGSDEETAGGDPSADAPSPTEPRTEPGLAIVPSDQPGPPAAGDTPTTTAPLVHVRTPDPPAQGPDGWPVAQSTIYGYAGWFVLTYHVEGDEFSFAEWIVDEYAEPVAVDKYSFPLRPGQNCLVTGAASDPYTLGPVPYRFVAGVVRADAVRVDPVGGVSGVSPDIDFEQEGWATLGPEVVPGLRTWMSTVVFDYQRVDVHDADGNVVHTASEAHREAFPDTC